jgi:hypothetical protein
MPTETPALDVEADAKANPPATNAIMISFFITILLRTI